jgi:serine/threonine-protein phosphatase 4 regulatory subunit 1
LAKDSYWPTREAAVSKIVEIANICPIEIRKTVLVKVLTEFYNDLSRFVKKAALLQVGNFIYSLKGTPIDPFLIQLYVSLDPKVTSDEDLIYQCAFSFPAVLLALGPQEWSTMKNTYKNLIKKDIIQVKATLAASIHEIAKLVGSKVATEELDSFNKMFLNDVSTIQLCFSHLHEFLQVVDEKLRIGYLELITKIIEKSSHRWRLRNIFALNAEAYVKLFDIQTIHKFIIPIIMRILKDQVVEVRLHMCKAIYPLVMSLKPEPKYFEEMIDFIIKLFSSNNFRDRQSFIYICEGFMCNEGYFDQYFMTQFLTLQKDRVVIVRLSLAKVLHDHMKNSGVLAKNVHITRTIQLLQNDPATEVKYCMEAASIECAKMTEAEAEAEKQKELERIQREAAVNVDVTQTQEDEEQKAEKQRENVEKIVKQTIKIDEMDEKLNKEVKK